MTNLNEVDVIELLASGDSEALAAFVASLPEPPPRRASGLFATFGYVRVPSSDDEIRITDSYLPVRIADSYSGSEWVAEPYDMDRALFGARLMGTDD